MNDSRCHQTTGYNLDFNAQTFKHLPTTWHEKHRSSQGKCREHLSNLPAHHDNATHQGISISQPCYEDKCMQGMEDLTQVAEYDTKHSDQSVEYIWFSRLVTLTKNKVSTEPCSSGHETCGFRAECDIMYYTKWIVTILFTLGLTKCKVSLDPLDFGHKTWLWSLNKIQSTACILL